LVSFKKSGKKIRSIKTLFIGLAVLAIFLIIAVQTWLGFFQFNKVVKNDIETVLKNQVEIETNHLAQQFEYLDQVCSMFASNVQAIPEYDLDVILSLMNPYIGSSQMVFGGGIWFEPFYLDPNEKYHGPYLNNNNGSAELTWVYSNEEYDYFQYDWYKNGLNIEKGVNYTEPFLDSVSNVVMMSISSPIKKEGQTVGVSSIDIGINEIAEYVKNIKVGENGYAFALTNQGYYLGSKTEGKDMTEKIIEDKDNQIAALGKTILSSSDIGIEETILNGSPSYVSYAPIGNTGLKLVTVMPEAEVVGVINQYVRNNIIICLISIIFLSFFLYILLTKNIVNPLNYLVNNTQKIASGDLTTERIDDKSRGEIGLLASAFNIMLQNLKETINQLQDKSLTVANSSTELSASAENIVAVTTETTSTISQVAVAVDQMTTNTRKIEDLSIQAASCATEGTIGIENVVKQMDSIQSATVSTGHVIQNLSDSASKISQIVEMITGIASQTNLLSLNAAIEAARAGEHGRGFAVVAGEVKSLAEQSAEAAKEIKELILGVQQQAQQAVQTMGQSDTQVQEGIRVVGDMGSIFQKINNSVEELANEIHSVASAVGQVSTSMETVAAASEEQTATMEEISATSQSLAALAADMDNLSAKFKLK